MPRLKNNRPYKPHLGAIYTLVFHHVVVFLLLTHRSSGQSQVVTPSQPIVATVGDDIMLPCHLEPAVDATPETVEWTRPDMDPRFVYVWRDGEELESKKHPSYAGRTSLSINKLKLGDISLKLNKVKLSDEGTYRCFVPTLNKESSVKLVVGATSSLIISLVKTDSDEDVSGAVLQCESKGWYPKPEALWLDGEGNLLSAGPAETVRGSDGLYTVSSRVTVEKRHSKSFTCRVQQKNINQTRETAIYVSDDFFKPPSSSSALTVGLAVSLTLCILFILLLGFFVWRLNRTKNKRAHEPEEGGERKQLMSDKRLQMKVLKRGKREKKTKHLLEEAENKVKILEEQLETKNKEVEIKQAELQRLKEEIQRNKKELKTMKEKLRKKIKEVEKIQNNKISPQSFIDTKQAELQELNDEKQRNENDLQTLNEELEKIKQAETNQTNSAFLRLLVEIKQAELQELSEEIQKKDGDLQTLKEELEKKNKQAETNQTNSAFLRLLTAIKQAELEQLNDEMMRNMKELQTLNEELEQKIKEVEKLKDDSEKLRKQKQELETRDQRERDEPEAAGQEHRETGTEV